MGEPRVRAQVARRLRPDPGGQAGLVGHGALEHEPLRLAQVERVPPAELERDLVGRVRVDHRVDRAPPLVVGAPGHRASPCRASRRPLERDPERGRERRRPAATTRRRRSGRPPRQREQHQHRDRDPDVVADDEVDDPVPEAAHAITTVGVRPSSRAKRSDHADREQRSVRRAMPRRPASRCRRPRRPRTCRTTSASRRR